MIKKIFFSILLILALASPLKMSAVGLFTYPSPPDSMQAFQPRCDYIISRFWERCNFEQAMRHPDEFNTAFGDWMHIMPHASADTVHASIDHLLARFAKKGGAETLALAKMAEAWVYSDTAQLRSEEIVYPFVKAAAHHKKINKEERAHFQQLEKRLDASMVGSTVPDLEFVRADGTKGKLSEVTRGSVLLIFTDPDDAGCSIARIRFDTDPNTRALIERGELSVVNIYPGAPTESWTKSAKDYPANWQNVAIADAYDYFEKGQMPMLYFLDSKRKVLAKELTVDYLLGAFRVTNESRKK